ncbi:MAG: hypothetical protein AB7P00_25210 [Sandaracinaceae bacterium]
MSIRSLALSLILLGALGGCSLGDCDLDAAYEVVYTADGTPALAGQALINQSCGGGGFCHSVDIEDEDRIGAPAGLDFNLNLASVTTDVNPEELDRLDHDQTRVARMRFEIWEQVSRGLMPPPGPDTEMVLASVPHYDRVGDDGMTFTPLPGLDTDEGREILRNWLACRTPVAERTVDSEERPPFLVGSTVPACDRRCVDPTWPDIAQQILTPSCATSRCHDADRPAAGLVLTVADPSDPAQLAMLRDTLTESVAGGVLCTSVSETASLHIVEPSDADTSLLYQKVVPDLVQCGSLMPLSGAIVNEQRACAIREWIACGACADPEDAECMACQETARATCGVVLDGDGTPQCMEQTPCERFIEPPPEG